MSKGEGLSFFKNLAQWRGTADFDEKNILKVLQYLDNPQDRVRSIQIAGTNGKGSVSSMIASAIAASGQSVGLTISPNLSSYHERILVDGSPVSDEFFGQHGLSLKQACEATGVVLSYFEGVTAIAFLGFDALKLDWMVLEVGLGGRLDATSTISKTEAQAIVTIALDHQHILGDTIEEIAGEKAGIIKVGSKQVVLGRLPQEALEVVQKVCEAKSVPYRVLGKEFRVENPVCDKKSGKWSAEFHAEEGEVRVKLAPGLAGGHQLDNAAVAAALGISIGLDREAIESGLSSVRWPGRLESAYLNSREIVFDCAHNPHGFESLARYLESREIDNASMVSGFLEGRDAGAMIDSVAPFVKRWHILEPDSDRAVKAGNVIELLAERGIKAASSHQNYEDLLGELTDEESVTPVVVAGSIFMVGPFRELVLGKPGKIWLSYE